ncbi:hypothetical protein Pdsh_01350 [Pyrodictium delaneyi]|uniref:Uncharacterized protein n=1 Tax=Pyrodictium delaneyi TaxID=1273541 RepID=A0A211YR13_9CREN|nr:hypothetical protein Pdsh_01350 [Pyrodictium delaneyi]
MFTPHSEAALWGWQVAAQRTLDEYLRAVGLAKPARPGGPRRGRGVDSSVGDVRDLVMCLRPGSRPRSVLVCGSLEDARDEAGGDPGGYLELGVAEAAGLLCKGGCPGAGTVVLLLDGADLGDRWWRLLVFWTIRSLPQRTRVVLVLPGLARLVEEAGGEEALPLKPPGEWSWLVTLVSRKIGVCWEAFV